MHESTTHPARRRRIVLMRHVVTRAGSYEVSGTGYTAGGATLAGGAIATSGTTAYVDFTDASWAAATFTARGAVIYNSSVSDKAVCVIDFGGDFTVTAGTFTISFPTADASNALIRLE